MKKTYLAVITWTGHNYSAYVPDLPGLGVTHKTLEGIRQSLAEGITIHCDGEYPEPKVFTREDAAAFAAELGAPFGEEQQVEEIAPLPRNPVSLEIARILEETRVSKKELAARLGITPQAISRMVNPFYWGHSLPTLLDIARALGRNVEVSFPKAG